MSEQSFPSPADVLEQQKQRFLTICQNYLKWFKGEPMWIPYGGERREVVSNAIAHLTEAGWSVREKHGWTFTGLGIFPSRYSVLVVTQ